MLLCEIFETHLFEEDCDEEDGYIQGFDANDNDFLISDKDRDDDYWIFTENLIYESFENLIENPIYDMSNEGSVYSKTFESCKEEHSNFSYDHSEPYHPKYYTIINNKDFERQCIKESDLIQPMEGHPKPTSSHS